MKVINVRVRLVARFDKAAFLELRLLNFPHGSEDRQLPALQRCISGRLGEVLARESRAGRELSELRQDHVPWVAERDVWRASPDQNEPARAVVGENSSILLMDAPCVANEQAFVMIERAASLAGARPVSFTETECAQRRCDLPNVLPFAHRQPSD
jgi:hypothetical protein